LSTAKRVTADSRIIGGAIYRAEDGRLLAEVRDLVVASVRRDATVRK
jgi:hypothetical protein